MNGGSDHDRDWDAPAGASGGNPYARDAHAPRDEHVGDDEDLDAGGYLEDDVDAEYGDDVEYGDDDAHGDDGAPTDDWAVAAGADVPPSRRRGDGTRDEPPGRVPSSRGVRLLVLFVLLAMLAAGIALESRDPEVAPARVDTFALDGPAVPPDDAVSTAWYCAAGTADAEGTADETIFVANLSTEPITAEVTVDPGGDTEPERVRIRVEPFGRRAVAVSDVLPVPNPGVVVEVEGGPAIVEHELRGNDDVAMSPCAQEPSNRWYFAAGGTLRGATQTLELFNPFGDDSIVDIAFLTESGVQEPQALQGFVVPRRSKVRVAVGDLVARQERVATVVRTRVGRIVAEQVVAFDGSDGVRGLELSLGVPTPRLEWTLPVAEATSSAPGTVAIANFGIAPTSVEVSLLLSGEGVLEPETVDVSSRSVVHFDPGPRVPAGTAYTVVVRGRGTTRIVAESMMLGANGAAASRGASTSARRWALAGAPERASSAVVVTNRGSRSVTVELRALTAGDPNSPRSAPALVVAPGRTVRFDLDERGIDPDQVLVVSADGPIVVGRETYLGGVSLSLAVPFPER